MVSGFLFTKIGFIYLQAIQKGALCDHGVIRENTDGEKTTPSICVARIVPYKVHATGHGRAVFPAKRMSSYAAGQL
jgi:hypothetical protein